METSEPPSFAYNPFVYTYVVFAAARPVLRLPPFGTRRRELLFRLMQLAVMMTNCRRENANH